MKARNGFECEERKSVDVVSNQEGFLSVSIRRALILAELSFTVGLGSHEESFLSSLEVLFLASPGIHSGVLESTSVRERNEPGSADSSQLIHGIQVQ